MKLHRSKPLNTITYIIFNVQEQTCIKEIPRNHQTFREYMTDDIENMKNI